APAFGDAHRSRGPAYTVAHHHQGGGEIMKRFAFAAIAAAVALPAGAQTWHGASQFNDDHAFTKAMVKFEELVKKYSGKPVSFVLHKNSELGLEKDYFAYMNQGKAVDYAIVSPAHMSTFSRAAPSIDAPFIFRDLAHWNKVPHDARYAGKTCKGRDTKMQAAVLKAGNEAGAYGRQIESSEDEQKLVALEKAGKLKRVPFAERAQMKKAVDPVIAAYAKEIGADE